MIKFPELEQNKPDYKSAVNRYSNAGRLGDTVKFYNKPEKEKADSEKRSPMDENFWERTAESARQLREGKFSFKDVLAEVPGTTKNMAIGIADTFAPALTKFTKTTGSIFGEGLAYAIDPTVREQYKAGNIEILPTIHNTTTADMAKYTIAAGFETAIYRSFPNAVKAKLATRGGIGALQGVGFAISEGMARDEDPEEIFSKMSLYGIAGGTLNIIAPYLMPLLKAEIKVLPKEITNMVKSVDTATQQEISRKLAVNSLQKNGTKVPISTPNKRYQAYLRSQGYEPYLLDSELPEIQVGPKPTPKESSLPSVDYGTSPNVFDPLEEASRVSGYEGYIPEGELPVIEAGSRVPKTEVPFTEMVPETTPKPATQQTPAKASEAVTPATPQPAATPQPTKTPSVVPAQEGATVTKVPGSQMPVGTGAVQTSRLEARMTGKLGQLTDSEISEMGLSTYNTMNQADQIARAAKYVEADPELAMAVLRGEKNPPNDLLYNSIALALREKAAISGDPELVLKAASATRLASLRSTRAGQEISILAQANPDDLVGTINEIVTARTQRAAKTAPKKDAATLVKNLTDEVKKVVKVDLKIEEAQSLLDDIMC